MSAYDPANGKRLWWVGGLSFEMKSTPVIKGDTLYINGFGSPYNDPGKKAAILTTEEAFTQTRCEQGRQVVARRMPNDLARGMGLGFADLDGDKMLSRADWDYYKAAMESDNGMLAIKLGGSGDMTAKSVRWKFHRGIPQLPSPLIYENVLYMVNDGGGRVTLLNPDDGELLLQGRLPGLERHVLRVAGRRRRQGLHLE